MWERPRTSILVAVMCVLAGPVLSQTLLDSLPAGQLEKFGAQRYRTGRPDLALPFYEKAIEKEPGRVSSLLAAAAILESDFQGDRAVALFQRVLAIEPRNRNALAGISRLAETSEERLSALRRLSAASRGEEASLVRERVRAVEALGGRPAFEVADPGKSYSFKLERGRGDKDLNPGWEDYPVLPVVAPNGETLMLLIGTANEGIWLTPAAAQALGARVLFQARYSWVDQGRLLNGDFAMVDNLKVGELRLSNCPIFVRRSSTKFIYSADGVIGSEVFKDFLIVIDHAARELRLTPRPAANPMTASRDFVPIRKFGPFLMAPVSLDAERMAYFVVNTIASDVNFQTGERPQNARLVRSGLTQTLTGWTCWWPSRDVFEVTLVVAMARWSGRATCCGMKDLNRAAGFKVTGVLGYMFLRGFALAIDYRHGVMGFIPQAVQGKDGTRRPLN
jgi:hypothetical protein